VAREPEEVLIMHPILFQFPHWTLYTYGLCVAIAAAVSFALAMNRSAWFGFSREKASDLVFTVFVSGVIGARFLYVALAWDEFRVRPIRMLYFQEGGLIWYGGFVAAVLGGWIFSRLSRMKPLAVLDFFAPLIPLAHAIGRLGCFFNGCCYGKPSSSRWAVLFPGDTVPRLPVQLHEAVFLVVLSFFLFKVRLRNPADGRIFFLYLFFYGMGRFVIEFWRGDQNYCAGATIPQWMSLPLIVLGLAGFLWARTKRSL